MLLFFVCFFSLSLSDSPLLLCSSSSTMGTCTSTARHRQKHQQSNRTGSKYPIKLDIHPPPPLPPHPLTAFPRQSIRYPQSLYSDFDIVSSSSSIEPIFHQTDTNSLIQLYSSNTNNNNNNNSSTIINYMSSSTSSVTHIPPRIPVPKTRVPVYQSIQTAVNTRPKTIPSTMPPNNQTGMIRKRNDSVLLFIGPFDFFPHICLCYQYCSHLVRITETNPYEVLSSFFPFLFYFLTVDLYTFFDGNWTRVRTMVRLFFILMYACIHTCTSQNRTVIYLFHSYSK